MTDFTTKKRSRDINQLANLMVSMGTNEEEDATSRDTATAQRERNTHAQQALGRLGGLKGDNARTVKFTPEERSEIPKKAAPM